MVNGTAFIRQLTFVILFLAVSVSSANVIDDSPLIGEYSRVTNASLLWGPYRSNLYVGVRPRLARSLLTGLMWYNSNDLDGITHLRHACDQSDNLESYGWQYYDPRTGGSQVLTDPEQRIKISSDFVKTDQGSWALKIAGVPLGENPQDVVTDIVFYAGLEGVGNLDLEGDLDPRGFEGDITLQGRSKDLNEFNLVITKGRSDGYPSSKHKIEKLRPPSNSHYISLQVPDDNVWRAKDIYLTLIEDSINRLPDLFQETDDIPAWDVYSLENSDRMRGNLHLIQKHFKGSFEFEILFNPESTSKGISSESIDNMLEESRVIFDGKFGQAFDLQAPFNTEDYLKFAQNLFSDLIGGIGYFYGTSLVDRSYAHEYDEDEEGFWNAASAKLQQSIPQEEGPFELFSAVPSRPFFPRGFYWDEGFHLIPILQYDPDLALEILKSWFSLIDGDGWIAREQILGPEARSKVPTKFQTQFPHYANPPTLMLILTEIIELLNHYQQQQTDAEIDHLSADFDLDSGKANLQHDRLLFNFLEQIYPKLQAHYSWFRRTQKGDIRDWDREAFSSKEGYRWRGRTPDHCLTSGLDDYPRAHIPHTGELHVDLLSWIGMMTRSMKQISSALGLDEDVEEYEKIETAIIHNIDDLHWSNEEKTYCDSTIDTFEESVHVCHKGYVSLFPFLLKLIPSESPHLADIIQLIRNPHELWSEYGVRSLSKNDPFFGVGENYWRGPVWININYMVLQALQHYGQEANTPSEIREIAAEVYQELRTNIVQNVYKNWQETGYAWEQYDSTSGKAQGVKHFLGWTSLVVMIMSMPETI